MRGFVKLLNWRAGKNAFNFKPPNALPKMAIRGNFFAVNRVNVYLAVLFEFFVRGSRARNIFNGHALAFLEGVMERFKNRRGGGFLFLPAYGNRAFLVAEF